MVTPTKAEAAKDKERRKEVARNVAYKAPAESARLIVALGQERLKALQAGGIALDTRTTQVAAIQLAAAAFSAGITVTDKVGLAGATLAGAGCGAFVVGSSLAFWGMRSCENQVAGVDPSFWIGALTATNPRFSDKVARSWAADITEDFIVDACAVDAARGRWLDRSLRAGAVGAALVVFAVSANLIERWMDRADKPQEASATGKNSSILPPKEPLSAAHSIIEHRGESKPAKTRKNTPPMATGVPR